MKKSRITTRLKDRTGLAKSKNRSDDLVKLRSKYQQFSKNLKFLITTLTNNHNAMAAYSKSRLEVAKAINSLTVDTPLFGCAGDIPANAVGTTDGGDSSDPVVAHDAHPTSYAAIHLQLHKKHKLYYAKYQEHILTYATEWERILSTRIEKHLKHSEKLRVDLDHYGKKVEDLNKSMNKTMSKGKSVGDSGVDKVKRNEQKLVQARAEYDRFVNDLCGFMEEVLERGWKDLHPLLVKMAQFDMTLSGEEATLLKGSMLGVTEQIKGLATKYPNLKPSGRLKELETFSLESLNKLNPSQRSESPLMITQGGGDGASYVTGTGDTAGTTGIHTDLIGGSTDQLDSVGGGGGLFGGPMNASQKQMVRNDSFASAHSGQGAVRSRNNTGDSFDWATGTHMVPAAPVPLAAGVGPGNMARAGSYRAAPSSGGLPPLGPQHRGSFTEPPQRSLSQQDMSASALATSSMLSTMQAAAPPPTLDDIFRSSQTSQTSLGGGLAPAPAPAGMPPPPPVMPPPPPPQAAMQMGQLSLHATQPATQHALQPMSPPAVMSPGGFASPSGQTAASSGTNPFDDAFGTAAPPPQAVPAYGQPSPGHNPYGTGGSAPTNPFG